MCSVQSKLIVHGKKVDIGPVTKRKNKSTVIEITEMMALTDNDLEIMLLYLM